MLNSDSKIDDQHKSYKVSTPRLLQQPSRQYETKSDEVSQEPKLRHRNSLEVNRLQPNSLVQGDKMLTTNSSKFSDAPLYEVRYKQSKTNLSMANQGSLRGEYLSVNSVLDAPPLDGPADLHLKLSTNRIVYYINEQPKRSSPSELQQDDVS